MKVLLSGASGFIGRHVLSELRKTGLEVAALTRNARGLSALQGAVEVFEMDISFPPANAFETLGSPDVLIHLAWNGLPNYRSLHHFEQEVPKQYAFLKSLVEGGLKSMVVAGTCFEYGMQSGALSEDRPALPITPYGLAKDMLRRQLEFLQIIRPFNLTWCRLFYMFGLGQAADSLYTQLSHAAKRGDPVFDMSGGEQLRDFLPVEEVARYIVHLAGSERSTGLINVCAGKPISVRNLVEKWLQDHEWKIHLNLGRYPYPDYEPMAFWGDTARLRAAVG